MARQMAGGGATLEPPLRMTYEEYLAWWDEDETHLGEWVDGEVIVFMPPKLRHQRLIGFVYALVSWYARYRDLGETVLAPFEMLILNGRASRQPDVLFVARDHLDRLTDDRLLGPADLAVEVVSDDSVGRDQQAKLAEYQAAGVQEYWIFDPRPRRHRAIFYRLGTDGTYAEAPVDADGRYRSVVLPGFWLDPVWLWQDPLPDPDALRSRIAPAA